MISGHLARTKKVFQLVLLRHNEENKFRYRLISFMIFFTFGLGVHAGVEIFCYGIQHLLIEHRA